MKHFLKKKIYFPLSILLFCFLCSCGSKETEANAKLGADSSDSATITPSANKEEDRPKTEPASTPASSSTRQPVRYHAMIYDNLSKGTTRELDIAEGDTIDIDEFIQLLGYNFIGCYDSPTQKDEKYIDAISKLESKTKEEAKQEITNKINEAKNNLANTESITFNIFTKGAAWEFVKLEISEIINNETNIYSITNIDDNNYQYAISNKQTNQNITGNIEYKTEKNNLYLKLDMNTEKKQSLTLTLNNKYQKAKKIELIDTNNVVKLSELSDEEKLNIISKIIFAN